MYKDDKKRIDPIMPQVRIILSGLPLSYFAEVRDAPIEMDVKYATDLILRITGGDIAARLRFLPCKWRQLTIRSLRDTKSKTELAKILEGFAYRYFYAWVYRGVILEWILVDLDKVREAGLLKKERRQIPNKDQNGNPDGTYFIAIDVSELRDTGCLIASQFLKDQKERIQISRTPLELEEAIEYIKKTVPKEHPEIDILRTQYRQKRQEIICSDIKSVS